MRMREWGLSKAVWSENIEGGGGEAAPAPAADASAPSSPADRMGVSQEVRDIFDFDPFEPGREPEAPAPVVEAPAAPLEATTPQPLPAAPPEGAVIHPAPAPVEPLQSAVQELRQVVQDLPNQLRPPAPEAPMTPETDPWMPRDGEKPLNYFEVMSHVPDAVMQNLGSENLLERKQAVAQLMGVAMTISHRLAAKQAVETLRREMSQILPQFVQERIQNYDTAQQVYKDFYGKYPQLSAPHFRPIVQQEAAKLSRQLGVSGWTPEFRDQLGKHVIGMLGQVAPAGMVPQAAPATQTMGPSARPAMANGAYNPGQDMAEMLGI